MLAAADAGNTDLRGGHALSNLDVASVGQLAALEVGPHAFDGVELGGVGRKPLRGQPMSLGVEVRAHRFAAVAVETIPQQHDALAAEVRAQFTEELDKPLVVVGSRSQVEVQTRPLAVP